MIESGNAFYSNKIQLAPTSRKDKGHRELGFNGLIIGLCLGFLKPKGSPPDDNDLVRLAANAGYAKLDDVLKCLGEEACRKVEDYIVQNYPLEGDENVRHEIAARRNAADKATTQTENKPNP